MTSSRTLHIPVISLANTTDAIARCLPVLTGSKPSLTLGELLSHYERVKGEGYRLAVVEVEGHVGCVGGFKLRTSLLWGRFLEIEDLVLSAHPLAKEYAAGLVEWLVNLAKSEGCVSIKVNIPHLHADGLALFLTRGFRSVGQHLEHATRGAT